MKLSRQIKLFDTKYGKFAVDIERDQKISTAIASGVYHQEETLELFSHIVNKDSVVIDVGGHIGTLAVPLAKMAKNVIAFEPNPDSFSLLLQNVKQNNLLIDARNKGLSAFEGSASIVPINSYNAGAHTIKIGEGDVIVSTLDKEIKHADLIKIDVEGMELDVLRGAERLINISHPIVFFEVNLFALRSHRVAPKNIFDFFISNGYKLYFPLKIKGQLVLGEIKNINILTVCIAPRSWFLKTGSAPFDLLALFYEKKVVLPRVSFARTLAHIVKENFKLKILRVGKFFSPKILAPRTIHKAVTLRASSIGDSLMGKYLLENIHAAYPSARCAILVAGLGSMIRNLLLAYPWIEVIEANSKFPRLLWDAYLILAGSDATVTQYSGRGQFGTGSKFFARIFTRRGRLAGFVDTWPFNRILYDKLIPFDSRRALRLHECDALLALGIKPTIERITLKAVEGNRVLKNLGLREKGYIIANLFSGTTRRGLSLPHQISIASELCNKFGSRKRVVLTGGPSDELIISKIKEAVPQALKAPGLSMQDLITLVSRSAGVVSLDTGVAHISAQTNVPLVVLRTCWGYNWWNKDQYQNENIAVLSREDLCASGHINKDFPDCLGMISAKELIETVKKIPILW